MTSIFENKKFLAEEEELNKRIQPWIQEAKKSYVAAKGFLGNKATIQKKSKDGHETGSSKIFGLATRAPKGGHLHIHLNSCLGPDFLLNKATNEKVNNWMYISLPKQEGALTKENYELVTKVKFHFMTSLNRKDPEMRSILFGDIFDKDYRKLNDKKRSLLKDFWLAEEEKQLDKDIENINKRILETDKRIQQKKVLKATVKEQDWLKKRKITLSGEEDKLSLKKKTLAKKRDEYFEKNINLDERMLFKDFIRVFKEWGIDAMTWLQQKLVFSANEVRYKIGDPETCKQQWDSFNIRTQMMAGLFNTEYVYREYIREFLNSLHADNIQYAEVRPNFMEKNQVFSASPPYKLMDNWGIMKIIIDEYTQHQKRRKESNKPLFGGLKVIYCTPRVFEKDQIQWALDECFAMKKDSKYEKYIAGFDIIGPENADNPLFFFKEELQDFQERCKSNNIHCPFLFHAGESHTDPNGNLDVALDLGAKRIAHCYAIKQKEKKYLLDMCKLKVHLSSEAKKREIKEKNPEMKAGWKEAKKAQELCIECCPISNEILGLHPHVEDAVVYKLMDEGIPCALASDNPTLFSSTLSYEFYQFMIGKPSFNLLDWRQLMSDSLEHAVWNDDDERNYVVGLWERSYQKFVNDELSKLNSAGSGKPQGINSKDVTDHGAHPPEPRGALAVKSNQENHAAAPTSGPDPSKTFKKVPLLQQAAHQIPLPPPNPTRPPTHSHGSLDSTRTNNSAAATSGPHQKQLNRSAPIPAVEGGNPAQKNVSTTTTTTATSSKDPTRPVVAPKRATGAATNQGQGEGTAPAPLQRPGSGSIPANTSRDSTRPVVPTPIGSTSTTAAGRTSTTNTVVQRQVSSSTHMSTSGGGTARPSPPISETQARRARSS